MMSLLNLGSVVLGLIAWILPIINLILYRNHDHKNWFIFFHDKPLYLCDFTLCNRQLVKVEDWSALSDITGAIASVSAVLLIITIL